VIRNGITDKHFNKTVIETQHLLSTSASSCCLIRYVYISFSTWFVFFQHLFLFQLCPTVTLKPLANVNTLLKDHSLEQCCPTFLYIGAHVTDGCGGAGAMWRLQ
jgi:hypothetical protein